MNRYYLQDDVLTEQKNEATDKIIHYYRYEMHCWYFMALSKLMISQHIIIYILFPLACPDSCDKSYQQGGALE